MDRELEMRKAFEITLSTLAFFFNQTVAAATHARARADVDTMKAFGRLLKALDEVGYRISVQYIALLPESERPTEKPHRIFSTENN
jgi:hypothetical protein